MPVTERNGELVDDTGYQLTAREDHVFLRTVGRYFSRSDYVLEGGLGFGQSRRSLATVGHVRGLRTIEKDQEVISLWRSRRQTDTDPDAFVDSPEDAYHTVEVGDVRAILNQEARLPRQSRTITSVFLDTPETLMNPGMQESLRQVLATAQSRLVMTWRERTPPDIPGFVCVQAVHPTKLYPIPLWIFDRWEPEAGIGTPVGLGKIRVPGGGWIVP